MSKSDQLNQEAMSNGYVTPTTQIKTSKTAPMKSTGKSEGPKDASRVWNQVRPKEAVPAESKIANHNDGGEKQYPSKPHLAPGVPRNELTEKGYTENLKANIGIKRGGSVDVGVANAYPAEAQTSYD